VNFSGRASRSEFWYAMLFVFLVSIFLSVVDLSLGLDEFGLGNIFSLAVLLPNIAVTARRLHDINRSGWFQLLGWLFPIGSLAVFVWFCREGSDADLKTVAEVF